MADMLVLPLIISLIALGTSSADPTLKLFQDTQYMPILLYECYRTGVTIEPENTVNFTILLDATQFLNKGQANTWYAPDGAQNQYSKGSLVYEYDTASSTIKITSPVLQEQLVQMQDAYNGLAYYWKLTIPSDNNRVVYKLYDVDSRCGNAAALLKKLDKQTKKGFVFSRDVARTEKRMQI
nr:uncharacterized protein LOC119164424 [Rhipicephalus microplus]